MDKQMKECFKPHAMLHTVFGIGIGMVLSNWLTGFSGQTGLVIGLFVVLTAFMGEFYLAGKKK
ncbi:hypothetical protein A3D78_05375 [Candidatus Gottesmanbacteria bacterium RIFCSPHIGHO2_02_FULL_39_14]|uniref:Uncharacterized protein n=2 Tax=Candidatus Gottesmaniibacteriota TaxID=1752720 RepID=A0A1F6A0E5_9BACT|nr:MAG: hypothetical protein A3D78_05375 [Candidatus Gottesmanbacteria bacterium RIFCSPHIGHO2_02_FULL_39_14]OGG32062.1 MAG: hypothetical protein A3I51_00800 [Candidatus Gottesmanbacteria bacterium RIFCSPLOWO2_02_FULL_38_8]